jgi:hypothetical protein
MSGMAIFIQQSEDGSILFPRTVGPLSIVNSEINIMVSFENSLKFLLLYFFKFDELIIECDVLQKSFYGFKNQN